MKKLIIALIPLIVVACTTAIPKVPEAPRTIEHRVAVADDVTIFYSVIGSEGPVVLVPLGRIAGDFEPIADAGFRVVLIDPRGRGLSTTVTDEVPISLETDLADIDAVRQDLDAERISLIGMSYYGALVAIYAARYPDHVDHLVMLGPMAPTAELFADRTPKDYSQYPPYLEIEQMRRDGLHESDPPAFCRAYYTAHAVELFSDPTRFDPSGLTYCDLENEWPDNILRWAGTLFATIGQWDFTEDAAHITAPTLMIQGRQDQITPPKGASAWSEAMKNQARLVWMDDCGHVPFKEHPAETTEMILDFLR